MATPKWNTIETAFRHAVLGLTGSPTVSWQPVASPKLPHVNLTRGGQEADGSMHRSLRLSCQINARVIANTATACEALVEQLLTLFYDTTVFAALAAAGVLNCQLASTDPPLVFAGGKATYFADIRYDVLVRYTY